MSEQEHTQEPSLEEILTSIRKKIATGDEVPLSGASSSTNDTPAAALAGSATGEAASAHASEHNVGSPASVDFAALGSSDATAKKEVYPGRLSDMLGRINDDELGAAQPDHVGNDDDLSDILDQPLPATDSVSGTSSHATAAAAPYANDTKSESAHGSGDVSFAQALGLATSNDSPDQASNSSGGATESVESLELTALEDDGSSGGNGHGSGGLESIELSDISTATSDDVPRVMTSLTSGFKIVDAADAVSPAVTTIEVNPANLDKPGEQAAVVVTSTPSAEPATESAPTGVASSNSAADATTPADTSAPAASASMAATAATAGPAENGVGAAPKSLEAVVEAMLRPMLHKWLEENMPRIVENALRIEVSEGSKDDRA